MTFQEQLAIINIVSTIIQVVVVTIALVYAIKQTSAAQRSVQESEKERLINTINSLRTQTREINHLMLQDKETAKLLGYSKADVFAFVLLHDLELKWLLKQSGIIDDQRWQSEGNAITFVIQKPFVSKVWQQYKSQYYPGFVKYVDSLMLDIKTPRRKKT